MSDDAVYAAIEGAVAAANEAAADSDESNDGENIDTSGEQVAEGDTSAQAEETAEPAQAAEAEPAKPSEDDELKLLEKELIEKTPTLGKGRIKLSRHQAFLERSRRQHEAALSELQKKYEGVSKYETPEWSERLRAIQLAETNPELFVKRVLLNVPEYQKVFDALYEERSKSKAAETPAEPAQTEMPQPDLIGNDGSISYSADGARKLVQWHLAQAEQKFGGQLEALRKDFAPVAEAHKTDAQLRASIERMRPVLENARANWRGFKENEAKIAEFMRQPGNERVTIHDAYREVVLPTFVADRTKLEAELREKILAELNRPKPRTSVAAGSVPAASGKESNEPRDTEDVIKEAIARAKVAA